VVAVASVTVAKVPSVESDPESEFDAPDVSIDDDTKAAPSALRGAIEWAAVLVGAVLVALVVRTFLFQAFSIPSSSMESTLEIRDRLLVNKLSYRFGDVERGDIVVFFRPESLPSPYDDLIKRVIGLPGDVVEGRGNQVFINGQPLEEPYLDADVITRDFGPVEVPADRVFVMGDNRSNSADSRVFGPIEIDRIEGEAFVRYWPLPRIGTP
jgi:signal peptidase I